MKLDGPRQGLTKAYLFFGMWQKAETAAQKKAVEDTKRAVEEEKQWSKGAKSNAKK